MDIFHRFVFGLLLVALGSLASKAHAEVDYLTPQQWNGSCTQNQHHNNECGARTYCENRASNPLTTACIETPNPNGGFFFWVGTCHIDGYFPIQSSVPESVNGWVCVNEPPPEPECPIPAGQTEQIISSSPLGSSTCYQNCLMTARSSGGISMMELTTGQRIYWYDATSTGDYCETPSGAQSAPPFENYTDEDGCYMGFDGRYCPSGGGSCPNSATAPDGGVYCRRPPDSEPCNEGGGPSGDSYCGQEDPNYQEPSDTDGNADSDGDGIPNADDPHPDDPDADGDGTPDGEQDGDGNGIPDGQPGGIDDDGEGDSPGVEDGSHDGGTCEQDERKEPDCSDDMDPTRCALAMELFHVRCDDKLRHEDIVGTEEYREGDSLTSDSEDNNIKTSEYDFNTMLADLDDSGAGFGGGAASCPPDKDINLDGIGTITIPMTFLCDWADKLRPLIIALGWLSAALIILSSMRDR